MRPRVEPTHRLVRAVAALGLPSTLQPPTEPVDATRWRVVLGVVTRRRLIGSLARAIDDGEWPATAEQRDQALRAQRRLCSRDLLLERELVRTFDLLTECGIPTLVLKGPALARLVYRSPDVRSFRDIDLLVRSTDLPSAVAALERRGARRHYPEPRPGYDVRFSKGVSLTTTGGWEIDLHRSLALGAFGLLIDPSPLWVDPSAIEIAGRSMPCPGISGLAAHACVHAVLGEAWPPLENLRDVATTLLHPGFDPDWLQRTAAAWQAEAVIAYAIGAACTDLELEPDAPLNGWAERYRPTVAEASRIDVYVGAGRDHSRQVIDALRVVPGWRDRGRYLRSIAMPTDSARAPAVRWRRGLRSLRGRP
jgi:hypothetical protein